MSSSTPLSSIADAQQRLQAQQAFIEQQQRECEQARQQQAAAEQKIAELQRVIAAAAQPAATPSLIPASSPILRPHRPRIPHPAKFSGTVGGTALDAWERELLVYFSYNHEVFSNQMERLRFVGTTLEGPALIWWQSEPKPADGAPLSTWAQCIAMFHARFRPVLASTLARKQLYALQQGKRSVDEYASQFHTILASIPDMSPADQVQHFIQGLQAKIAQRVFEHQPTTLVDAVLRAANVEGVQSFIAHDGAASGRAAQHSATGAGTAMDLNNVESSTSAPQPTPPGGVSDAALIAQLEAQLNSLRSGFSSSSSRPPRKPRNPNSQSVPGLDHKTLEQRKRDRSCFRCGKPGHWKHECTNAPVVPDSATTSSPSAEGKPHSQQGK